MKEGQSLWTREQLLLAINLYIKLPFGRLHSRNPEVIELARSIGRTPDAVAYKLVNFASLDPSLQKRGIKGASNTSKLDRQVWDEFYQNWDSLPYESEVLRAQLENKNLEAYLNTIPDYTQRSGIEAERTVKVRVNQYLFRKMIMAAYNNTCCITGLSSPQLLVASHINTWSSDEKNRLNPSNGLALNSLHDRAYENGLITITPEYKILVSSVLKSQKNQAPINDYFLKFENSTINLPSRFLPDPIFLKAHYDTRFKA